LPLDALGAGRAGDGDDTGARAVQRSGDVGAEAAGAADHERRRAGDAVHHAYESSTLRAPVPGVVSSANASAAALGWKRWVTTPAAKAGDDASSSIAAGKSSRLFRVPTSVSSLRVITISGMAKEPGPWPTTTIVPPGRTRRCDSPSTSRTPVASNTTSAPEGR